MRIVVGDEVGLLKRIDISSTSSDNSSNSKAKGKEADFSVVALVSGVRRERAIDVLVFAANRTKVVAGTKDGHIQVIDVATGTIDSELMLFDTGNQTLTQKPSAGNKAREDEHFVGLFEANGTIITCTNKGNINYLAPLPFLVTDSLGKPLPTVATTIGQDALTAMKVFPENPSYFATAGVERELCLWRIVSIDGSPKLESVWKAKNVANDHLDLRVPVHVTDLAYLPPPPEHTLPQEGEVKPTRIAIVTLYKHFRVYDVYTGKRRPTLSVTVGDMPAKKLAITKDGREAIVTDTTGSAIQISIATGERIGAYRGFQGAVTSISCVNITVDGKEKGFVVTAGLDRMVRIFLKDEKRTLLRRIYLKHRLHAIVVDESFIVPSSSSAAKINKKVKMDMDSKGTVENDQEEDDADFFARMQEPDEDDIEEDVEQANEELVKKTTKKVARAGETNSKKRKKTT